MNGTDFMVRVNTGTEEEPTWTTVAKQTGASLSEKSDFIDMSSKDSRAREGVSGRYEASLSLDALIDYPAGEGYAALRAALRDGTLVQVQTAVAGDPAEQAYAVVTDLSADYPDQDTATFSASFEITGEWSDAAA